MSKWKKITSYVSEGSILEPILFSVFSNDINSGLECTLGRFAEDIKLNGAVYNVEGRDATQRDLEEWVHVNLMKDVPDHGRTAGVMIFTGPSQTNHSIL